MPKKEIPPGVVRLGCIGLPLLGILLCAVLLNLLVLRPASRWFAARAWTPVPCRVVSSEVARIERPGTGTHYKALVRYRYTHGGRDHIGSRLDFIDDTGSRYPKDATDIVARHPPGQAVTCYVNPAAPQEAVLNRGLPARMWWGVLPAVLLAGGVIGLLTALFVVK